MCAADDTRDRECTSNFATLLIFAQRFPLCTKCNFVHTHTHTHTHLSVAVFARAMCICTSAVAGVSHAFQVKRQLSIALRDGFRGVFVCIFIRSLYTAIAFTNVMYKNHNIMYDIPREIPQISQQNVDSSRIIII